MIIQNFLFIIIKNYSFNSLKLINCKFYIFIIYKINNFQPLNVVLIAFNNIFIILKIFHNFILIEYLSFKDIIFIKIDFQALN